MRRNAEAAWLAVVGGVLLLIVGYSGVNGVDHFFGWLEAVFGDRPVLYLLAAVFGGIASLGGAAVLVGAWLIHRDRVRSARILIVLGSGAGLFSLLLFLFVNLAEEQFNYLLTVLPAIAGIAFGIGAQWRAKPAPLLGS